MFHVVFFVSFFFFNDTATTEIYTLSLHDALPISVRSVLEEQAQRPRRRRLLGRRFLEDLEALDVALVLEDARDLGFQPRRGHVDARVLGGHRVADPREHVGNGISHLCSLWLSAISSQLPAALGHARDVALERQLAEAQAAQGELAHVGARAAAQTAAVPQP